MLVDAPAPGPRAGSLLIQTTHSLVSAGTERMLVDFGKAGWLGKARQQPEKVRAVIGKIRSDGPLATLRAVRAKLNQPIPLGYCNVGVVISDAEPEARSLELGARSDELGAGSAEPGARSSGLRAGSCEFHVGDRVISNGPHAEVVSVTQGLCAKIPDGVSSADATFTPLASIALEGITLLKVEEGDRVVVTGLGLIGQLAVRMLRAKGCDVLGFDPSDARRALAEAQGAKTVATSVDPVTAAMSWTDGIGVTGVLITASAASNEIVNQAARSCRRRGRVVLVGVVGLQLNRADFYQNEISFQVSCSYGVRAPLLEGSAQTNFRQVLAWMAAEKLVVNDLITHEFNVQDATEAYTKLADRAALGIILNYARDEASERMRDVLSQSIDLEDGSKVGGLSVGVIGAGNFATRTLLPALTQLVASPRLAVVVSNQGTAALLAARAFGASRATTDGESIFSDPILDAVFLTTRHDTHTDLSLKALAAGKHVWVEKPLCLNEEELRAVSCELGAESQEPRAVSQELGRNREVEMVNREEICPEGVTQTGAHLGSQGATESQEQDVGPELIVDSSSSLTKAAENKEQRRGEQGTRNREPGTAPAKPVLMVGFNRRFAPMAVKLRAAMDACPGICHLAITVNAGRLPSDHWTLDPKMGGGRIVGEACHFIDLSRFLLGQPIVRAECQRRDTDGQDGGKFVLHFADGSTATIDYRTDLPTHIPKEQIKLTGTDYMAEISNWSKLKTTGLGGVKHGGRWSRTPNKGHPEALTAFLNAMQTGQPPIPYDEIMEVSRVAVELQAMKMNGSLKL